MTDSNHSSNKETLQALIRSSLAAINDAQSLSLNAPAIKIDDTRDKKHGDLASNVALTLAKQAGMNPRQLAEHICNNLPQNDCIDRVEIAGPGFINFYLSNSSLTAVINTILEAGDRFGHTEQGPNSENIQVEFVSANPTGPLHVGHGRGAAIGDSLCRLLAANGHQVTREFYYNDAGQQINNLMRSVQLRCQGLTPDDEQWPEDGYRGDYITDVANAYMAGETISDIADSDPVTSPADAQDEEAIRRFAVAYLRQEQDRDLNAFDVKFDTFFLESSLYADGKVEEVVETLIANGYTYEQDGALWLKTTEFGDDKDRVMRKSEGGYTYFVPDLAYHLNKWQRGFTTVINEQGADHHSTITRVRAGLQGLKTDIPEGWPDYVLHQMVTVMRNGEEVKISKRAGSYVTLRDLIEQVGCDATRYFLTARRPDSQLIFDIDLALQQNNDNPVYYIQYAHARICSVLKQANDKSMPLDTALGLQQSTLLNSEAESALLKQLALFPECIQRSAQERAPHNIATYLRETAAKLHSWYNQSQFLVDDTKLRNARLTLAAATRQVIANGLAIMGVSAPEKM